MHICWCTTNRPKWAEDSTNTHCESPHLARMMIATGPPNCQTSRENRVYALITVEENVAVEDRIATLESDVSHLRSDVADIKSDLKSLRSEVGIIKSELSSFKTDVARDLG